MKVRMTAVALLLPLATVSAQGPTHVAPGTRVRVTVAGPVPRVMIGTCGALTDSTLEIGPDPSSTIPLAGIARLESSRGRRASLWGGGVGLVLGAAVGAAAGCSVNRDDYGVFCGGQSDTKVAVGAVLGAAAGAFLGGRLLRRERWSEVELARLRPAER